MVPGATRRSVGRCTRMLAPCWWPFAAASGPPGCSPGWCAVAPSDIVAVVNVGDDTVLHGLHISPDLDTVTYTLAGMDNRETGWGVAGETWATMDELARIGGEDWFRLGDRDLATHLFRTGRLHDGATLSEVTAELTRRRGIEVRLVPVTDEPLRTRLTLGEATALGAGRNRGRIPGLLRPATPRRRRDGRQVRGRVQRRDRRRACSTRWHRRAGSWCARRTPSSRSSRSSPCQACSTC